MSENYSSYVQTALILRITGKLLLKSHGDV